MPVAENQSPETPEVILFITGRLAAEGLRGIVQRLSAEQGFVGQVLELPINVAALMHEKWVLQKLEVPAGISQIVLPGWCQGNLETFASHWGVTVIRGPKDMRDLPQWWTRQQREPVDLTSFDIEIIAEINGAPALEIEEILRIAESYRTRGADLIDYGCLPGASAQQVERHVRALVEAGFRVSIDSFDRAEVQAAVRAGASLILSANSSNVDWICELATECVVIPDDFQDLSTWDGTLSRLESVGIPYRLDPILEPIGFGFAASLQRYYTTRQRHPSAPMMMGTGNLTELSEVDSAGVNFLLTAICQELQIGSVLTTDVINWCRESVREIDLARRMVHYAISEKKLPKHLDAGLLTLRDPHVHGMSDAELLELASRLKDPNFRILQGETQLHLMNRDGHYSGNDPFELFRLASEQTQIDPGHAFYLGYELAMAELALQLGKQYLQDEPLYWGAFTRTESHHSLRPRHKQSQTASDP
ncbi:MAG: dihydropteroate synthase [Planctomycetaceae bacterium]|nr:dihydropteroate synthase [Planctomycetaceae bacterium]